MTTTTPAMPELPEPYIHHHMMTVWRDVWMHVEGHHREQTPRRREGSDA